MGLAASRTSNPPLQENCGDWLQLMQHHGLNTRLLDWTWSPLVALFFALDQHFSNPTTCCVYRLDPWEFNLKSSLAMSDMPRMPDKLRANDTVSDLIQGAFDSSTPDQDDCIALYPTEFHTRIAVQQGAFTIHGSKLPLESNPQTEGCLTKLVIHSCNVNDMRHQLNSLGIRRRMLFPDLDNLAKEMNYEFKAFAIDTELS